MTIPEVLKKHISHVSSFESLSEKSFQGNLNAFCWERNLKGDFTELVSKLQLKDLVTEITEDDLLSLQLSEKANAARQAILNDLQLLTVFGASPQLNLIKNYERDDAFDFITTDVYSFHIDRAPIATSTFLCTYFGAASEIIANEETIQKIRLPDVRQRLETLHHGEKAEFEEFLKDHYFDLHYEAKSNSKPLNLGIGNLWRLAVDHPGQKNLPCVHRAPVENNGELRLLLIC